MEENKDQQSASKVMRKFETSLRKLEAITSNPHWFKPKSRVTPEELPNVIQELADEQKESLLKSFKEALKNLIQEKDAHDRLVKKKEKEFQNAVLEEVKKLQVKLDAVLGMVDNIASIEDRYYDTLKSIAEPAAVPSPMADLMENEGGVEKPIE